MSSAYLLQLEQKVNFLINERKFKEAYDLCREILSKYPRERTFEKLKAEIESAVEDQNAALIEVKIEEAEKLYDAKKYADALILLKQLAQLAPQNKKIINFEEKVKEKYKEEVRSLRIEFKKNQTERLSKILNENPNALPDELFQLETNNPRDTEVFQLTQEFRDKLIEKKIKEKEELLNSNKYDVIANYIEQLRKIDARNPRIAKILEVVLARKKDDQYNDTKEFVYKGEKYLDTMIKLKKYDKAMQASQEILTIESSNKAVKKIYNKARRLFFNQTRNIIAAQIKESWPQLQKEYQQNKSQFVSL